MTPNPPRVDPALVPALRTDLVAARYTVAGVTELLGPMATAALDRDQALPAQRVTAASSAPGATLVRLFALGDPVDVAEAAAALPTLGVDGAVELGLVEPEGDAVVARCDLRPYAADGVRLVGGLRPRRGGRPGARCGRTTCSASAARRRPWRRGPRGRTSTERSTSAPGAACRPCTSRGTPTRWSSPTCPSGRWRSPGSTPPSTRPTGTCAPGRCSTRSRGSASG